MGVNVPSEIKRFNCMTPISVSRRIVTKCLCSTLNMCPSAIICRLLSSKYFKKPRTAVSINAAIATICENYQCVQQRSSGPNRWCQGGTEGPDSIISSSDWSSAIAMRTDKEHVCREQACCIALWDPVCWTWGQGLISREETLELEGRCSKVCPMEGKHEGSCHRHTQVFAEVLYKTDWLVGKCQESQERTKVHYVLLFHARIAPHQLADAVSPVRAVSSILQFYCSFIIPWVPLVWYLICVIHAVKML